MEKPLNTAAPYFDPQALRNELTSLFQSAGDADKARSALLERLKELVSDARAGAEAGLNADGNGRRCAAGLSQFEDELIRLIFDYTTTHVYRATNPSDAERMAIVATGGYGRGLLAPGSDIDLLFLLPYKQTPWGESVVEYILYMLWDLGFKVGHATRNVDQCIKLSIADLTIRTAVLDSRLILGDGQLFEELEQRFRSDVVRGGARTFIDAKMQERDDRHKRSGESRYRVEPNIKDGKGGLRDLHTLHWLSKYLYGEGVGQSTIDNGAFTKEEVNTFEKCEDFLWTVRCYLHFLTGRPVEQLSFDVQEEMASRLGYKRHGGLRAVERFMKHYFLVAKDVGDLTTILCNALEIQQLKTSPGLNRLLNPLSWRTRREVRQKTDFRIENDRINVSDHKAFERDPVNIIRFFAKAEHTDTYLHPDALRLIRRALPSVNHSLQADPEANRIFLELLTGRVNPQDTLRRMSEADVLSRFIPAFRRVVGMMQFNMYHHYTVDEHLIRTVGKLTEIERGGAHGELPLCNEIVSSIKNRRVLYVAAFLHDIGKGREEDHSIVGGRIARDLCPRLGLTKVECDTVVWLIEQHLTMSNIAQSRDISDPKTIRDFAELVQTQERLKLLLLLTVADIRAVGPGTWNGWKGQLLRTLYYETEAVLSGGLGKPGRTEQVAEAQETLKLALPDLESEFVEQHIERFYPDYWVRFDTRQHVEHARLMLRAHQEGTKLATDFTSDAFTAITELTVFAPNHPRLLALFAGACSAAGANILGAHITTTRDGFALDTFLLQRELADDYDENRRARRIGETIEKLLRGEVRLTELLNKRRSMEHRLEAFSVEPEVVIDNSLSDQFTVLEVEGRDRPGLLYDLTSAISDLNLDISSAHITTFGEKVVDVFYVTDLTSKKIVSSSRQKSIETALAKVLSEQGNAH
ncbi:MAG: [protein-PII] uridylyltransferase [Hyphomicrobiaceae bacterium]|nr:[protein-PII] uridylyltransferase [Hyphomicrobiaceae bacterium]MCC0009204.1 [protein-PII] uridylyltransferase [Hyphomicrobiaceae bacterium]